MTYHPTQSKLAAPAAGIAFADRNTSWPCSTGQFTLTCARHKPTYLDPNPTPLARSAESLPNPPSQGVRSLVVLHDLRYPTVPCLYRQTHPPCSSSPVGAPCIPPQ